LFGYTAAIIKSRIVNREFLIPVVVVAIFTILATSVILLLEDFIYFAFELFMNYFDNGDFNSVTTDTLIDEMFIYSNNIFSLIYGTGNFGRGQNYIESDIGWVLFLSGGGIIGLLILYVPHFYLIFFGYTTKNKFYLGKVLIYLIFLLLILNFKDVYYLSHGYIQPVYLLFSMCLINNGSFVGVKNKFLKMQPFSSK
jgi:hypothetical protein